MSENAYRNLSLEETLDRLLAPQPTCILFHVHPDADAIGSAFALAAFLESQGSPCYCLCADEIPARLAFLTENMQTSVLPNTLPADFDNARLISVDTASPAQLGALYGMFGDRISLMIDHHEMGTPYADHLIVPGAAACGEIIFDLIAASGKEAPAACAPLLYAAISSDTGGFRHSNVTKETHLRAAALVESGIDVAELSHKLFEVKTFPVLRAERLGFDKLHLFDGGRIGISSISFEDKQFNKLQDDHLSTVVDLIRSVAGVEIAVAIRQPTGERVYRVSMRANVDFDVAAVCAKFGGGGHRRAAGATLTEFNDIAAAEQAILAAIQENS
ncbi:MAG: DHH family phosphoesterase [Clostridia bacterium]|nr:DHH family phosphoesterase [Clostridia bacterium]